MEIEIKFRIEDVGRVEEKVKKFAEFVIDKIEEDIYFNSPIRDFKRYDEALRIRKDIEGVSITYKGPKIDKETKSREEIKVGVDNYDKAVLLLKKLGFREVGKVLKRRKIYRHNNVLICIDSVFNLGDFIEIEVVSDDIEKAKEEVFKIAESIGLDRRSSLRESYLEMLMNKNVV